MRFLLRLAFWLGVVLVVLPSIGSQTMPNSQIGTFDALAAAKAAIGDLQLFCERQSEACNIGSQAAVVIGHRAQAGAKMLYEFLNEQFGPQETGSVGAAGAPAAKASQQSLTPDDLAPAWRGPQPRRDPRDGRA